MKTRLLLIAIVGASHLAVGGEHDKETPGAGDGGMAPAPCSVESLTRSCEMFDPKKAGRKIKLADGTFIHNYAYNREKHEEKKEGKETEDERKSRENNEANDALLGLQEKLTETLNGIGKKKTTLRFTIAMTDSGSSPTVFSAVWERWAQKPASPKDEKDLVYLPFPPDDPKAKPGLVPFSEVRKWLDDNLGPRKKEIDKWLTDAKTVIDKSHDTDSNDEDRRDRQIGADRVKKVAGLFELAKKKAGEIFAGKLTDPKVGEAEKAQIKTSVAKLNKLKLRGHDDSKVKDDEMCRSPIPNAWYDPDTLTVSVCPAMYNLPDASLIEILGHEVGHSIDPCNSQCPVCSIDRDKLAKKETIDEKDPKLPPPEEFRLNAQLNYSLDNGSTQTGSPLELNNSKELLKKYEAEGILKTDLPGIPFASYPLKDVYDCLSSAKGGGFRKFSSDEVNKIAKELAAERAKEKVGMKPPGWAEKEEKRIATTLSMFPECVGVNRNSHMGEAMADWIGSKVLGSYLKEEMAKGNKLDTPVKKLAVIGFSASLACMNHFDDEGGAEAHRDVSKIVEEYRSLGDPHPGSKARMEKIVLRNREVRKALGCEPDDDECGKGWGT